MLNRKLLLIIASISTLLILTACWDDVELEDRAFIHGATVDLAEQHSKQNQQLTVTEQLVVPSGVGFPSSSGTSDKAYRNLSKSGESLMNINRDISQLANRALYAQHLEVLIFSEDVVKEPNLFQELLDLFGREQQMRRGIRVAIAKGKASPLLEVKPEHMRIPSQYIAELLENKRSAEVVKTLRLGDLHEYLFADVSFIIPYLSVVNDTSIENSGAAVFNGSEGAVIGTLDGELTKGRNLITGDAIAATMTISVDDSKATIDLTEINSDLKLVDTNKNNLKFDVVIDITGVVSETTSKINPYENLDLFANGLEKAVKDLTSKTIDHAQQELKTDVFKLDSYLHGRHYQLWQSIKDDWDSGENYFANSKINVTVNARMEHSGSTIYTTEKEK